MWFRFYHANAAVQDPEAGSEQHTAETTLVLLARVGEDNEHRPVTLSRLWERAGGGSRRLHLASRVPNYIR